MTQEPNLPKAEEAKFQTYKSSRTTMRCMTDEGKHIVFVSGQLITDDEDIIVYMDREIKARGLPGITKGPKVSAKEADPMSGLRDKFFKEFAAEQEKLRIAEALGKHPDMGTTKQAHINPASSKNVPSGPSASGDAGVAGAAK